jgi:predicted Kef-type K+ transport protein
MEFAGRRKSTALAAALLQATSLPFIVAASMIGIELGLIDAATGAGLVAAGLLSVLIFPLAALTVLRAGSHVTVERSPSLTDIAPNPGGTT